MRKLHLCGFAFVLCLLSSFAIGQSYPARPVRMIVPFPPGGSVDIIGRIIGQKLSDMLGTQFVIDNRPGAGSVVGISIAAGAPPDGYTLALVSVAFAINDSMHEKRQYDAEKDFAPISMVASAPNLLVLNPSLPIGTIQEFVTHAKQSKGSLNYASAGVGTPTHLAGELFNAMSGAGLVHVPYRGGGPAFVDVISGQVKVMFPGLVSALPHVRNKKLKVLGITSTSRSPTLPEVPTIAESGYPGYEAVNWYAALAPAKTPPAIISQLGNAIAKVVVLPDVQESFARDGAGAIVATPPETKEYIKREIIKWRKIVREAGVLPQ